MSTIRFNPTDHPLASRVARSPRLWSLLDADEVAPLVASVEAAERTAKAAAAVPFAGDTATVEVHAKITQGKDVDAGKVIAAMASAGAAKAAHEAAQAFLLDLPRVYKQNLAAFIQDSRRDLYSGLSTQLDDVLDRAAPIVASLDGAHDAEAAMDAGKTEEFSAFRDLAAEYASVRAGHRDLLRSDDYVAFTDGSGHLPHAFFGGIQEVYPDIEREAVSGSTTQAGWRTSDGAPFPVWDVTDRAHFLFVVQHRAALRPHVATAEQAKKQAADAFLSTPRLESDYMPDPERQVHAIHGGEQAALTHAAARSGGVTWHGWGRPQ